MGSRETLLPLFNTIDNYPLLIRALAAEVARYRCAPGDFNRWKADHPNFNPFDLPLIQVKSHVLQFALQGLSTSCQHVLRIISAFRMPTTFDTLVTLLVGNEKAFASEDVLDVVLTELEDRGLLGWDRQANRYDLHPIVRGIAWNNQDTATKLTICWMLQDYFESLMPTNQQQISKLEDLTPLIELYNLLIDQMLYNQACDLFFLHLDKVTNRLNASYQRIQLLERLFPDGTGQLPKLSSEYYQTLVFDALASSYHYGGRPEESIPFFHNYILLCKKNKQLKMISTGFGKLTEVYRLIGKLLQSGAIIRQARIVAEKEKDVSLSTTSLVWQGLSLMTRGRVIGGRSVLEQALSYFDNEPNKQFEALASALWHNQRYG